VPKRAAGQPSRLPEGGQRVYPYRAPGSAHERRPGCSAVCRRGAKREGDGGPVASRFGRLRELGEGSSVRITGKHVSFTAMRNCSRRHFLMPRRRCDYCVQALCTTRTRRSSSSNGLRRKANAPPRSACTTWPSFVLRNEDDRRLKAVCPQIPLQLQTAHARKLSIEDQAVHAVPALGRQKVLRRSESSHPVPSRSQ
jgi:hypothetical protein